MTVNLSTPIVNSRTPAIKFFNGRLLSGEDLTTEQQSNRAARALLGRAIGSGVVNGFEVSEQQGSSTIQNPVVTVTAGLAVNLNGASLLLESDADIALMRPAVTATSGTASVFQDCTPVQSGTYVAGAGAYLLVVGPASAAEGLAQVNGTSTTAATCNVNYQASGVQFRLVQIPLTQVELSDLDHLQNTVAYKCFGLINWDSLLTGEFVAPAPPLGAVDQLRQDGMITNCEVPLAVLCWTADNGLIFVDEWSVRRRILQPSAVSDWTLFAGDLRTIEGESMFLQFQDQITQITNTQSNLPSVNAQQYFNYLPPVGILPLNGVNNTAGFSYQAFFAAAGHNIPMFVPAARMEGLVREAMNFRPIDLTKGQGVWLYRVAENATSLPYLIFTTIFAPFQGSAQFDLASFDFANFQ